ncbi:hypothetical protein ACPPVT_20275 [Angustibacter sp. McL0619]|uniref:hypothetical protein n=1 Tax=Angustibacter sp. McL0619 TaxID=3415676 RepID=UPI003CEA49D2
MASDPIHVRPTRRSLDDLGSKLPDLGHPLDEIDDPIVISAQTVPEQRDAGGVERVVALTDRVWFKVKTGDHRATVTELRSGERPEWAPASRGGWWIGAAGRRQADSRHRDFYACPQRECTTGKAISTDHLLPHEWDWKRLAAEQAVAWRRELRRMVIGLIASSLKTGHLAVAEFRKHRLKALVRAENGHEAYLAIIAEGVPDPDVFALLLDCVPGIAPADWQPEPSALAEMTPEAGEIIWSTLFPSDVASAILELGEE